MATSAAERARTRVQRPPAVKDLSNAAEAVPQDVSVLQRGARWTVVEFPLEGVRSDSLHMFTCYKWTG